MKNANLNKHWVCFACRKQFRQPMEGREVLSPQQAHELNETKPCPECHAAMTDMGGYFCPPRRDDRRAWEQMRLLAKEGVKFYTEDAKHQWGAEGVTQKSIRETREWMQKLDAIPRTQGEALLQWIAQKRARAKNRK